MVGELKGATCDPHLRLQVNFASVMGQKCRLTQQASRSLPPPPYARNRRNVQSRIDIWTVADIVSGLGDGGTTDYNIQNHIQIIQEKYGSYLGLTGELRGETCNPHLQSQVNFASADEPKVWVNEFSQRGPTPTTDVHQTDASPQ
ncbi:hypothetical protein HAX54_014938 [Datura stramonium]|uniref:Uncharacterized protein n=1 Tax=Datura stramonium TaxID=4076 RepID=A0ABS8TP20_DATST|nr:hypothetical protein [Datura stramonium]